jgi:hypothetical protein
MTSEELHAKWRAKPFRPFRAVMIDGRVFDVLHPWNIVVGRGFWNFYHKDSPDVPFDDVDHLSPEYIDHVEDLPVSPAPRPASA